MNRWERSFTGGLLWFCPRQIDNARYFHTLEIVLLTCAFVIFLPDTVTVRADFRGAPRYEAGLGQEVGLAIATPPIH